MKDNNNKNKIYRLAFCVSAWAIMSYVFMIFTDSLEP